jgi:uncharacterized phage infection (PIP) family protein YhgE
MTPQEIKEKIEKREAELQELKKQAKEAEVAERKAQEQAAKLEALSPQISDAIQTLLNKAKIALPAGKQIITTMGRSGYRPVSLTLNSSNQALPTGAEKLSCSRVSR